MRTQKTREPVILSLIAIRILQKLFLKCYKTNHKGHVYISCVIISKPNFQYRFDSYTNFSFLWFSPIYTYFNVQINHFNVIVIITNFYETSHFLNLSFQK